MTPTFTDSDDPRPAIEFEDGLTVAQEASWMAMPRIFQQGTAPILRDKIEVYPLVMSK